MEPNEALSQLLQKKTGYAEGLPGALSQYRREAVSLPKGQENPCPLVSLLDGENKACLEDFQEKMMLSLEEQAGVAEDCETVSFLDPVLEHDPKAYHDFIADLINAGLLAFTVNPKIQIGCFFVTKKGGKLRLVVDARRANRYFKKPPSTLLGSMETWGRLELPEEGDLFIAQEDVKDFFYRLGISKELGEYFSLPEIQPRMLQAALGGVLPPEVVSLVENFSGQKIYPHFKVLPMGFSWAFHLAHEAHAFLAKQVLPHAGLLQDRRKAPLLEVDPQGFCMPSGPVSPGVPSCMLIYADNNNHLGLSRQQVSRDHQSMIAALHEKGLDTHDILEPSTLAESLGVRVDGMSGRVGPTAQRDWRLEIALRECEKGPAMSGEELEVIVGHVTVRAMLHRGLLSILKHVYSFIADSYHFRQKLWPSVIKELKCFRALMVLGIAELRSTWDGQPLMTDACLTGYAVCEGNLDYHEVREVAVFDERWRFKREGNERVAPRVRALGDPLSDPRTVLPDVRGEVLGDVEMDPNFPEIPLNLLQEDRWHTLWATQLHYREPVHLNEGRSILSAAKHRSRDALRHGKRVLIMNDNMGVVLACMKGRCASYGLLRTCQKMAAESLASGIRFYVRWIPSELNVADHGSRLWEPSSHQKNGCRIVQPKHPHPSTSSSSGFCHGAGASEEEGDQDFHEERGGEGQQEGDVFQQEERCRGGEVAGGQGQVTAKIHQIRPWKACDQRALQDEGEGHREEEEASSGKAEEECEEAKSLDGRNFHSGTSQCGEVGDGLREAARRVLGLRSQVRAPAQKRQTSWMWLWWSFAITST